MRGEGKHEGGERRSSRDAENAAGVKAGKVRKTKGDVITTPKELFPIVAIGSSAGGLEALDGLFRLMPSDSGTAFILVSHLDPGHESLLSEILQRVTKMPVTEATDKMLVEPNHLYVIPPNRDMAIVKGELQLRMPESVRGLRMPIDFFFRSLADDRGERAIAILLSGTGTDGTMGLRAILGAGGVSFIQDPSSAQYDGMPVSAIQNGLATYVLPVPEMPGKLAEYIVKGFLTSAEDGILPADSRSSMSRILTLVRSKTGNDFAQYKQNTIRRRLHRRMISQGIDEEDLYARFLVDHPDEIDHLFKEFLINVTSFFRDPESYETLRKEVLPSLLDDKPDGYVLRVWVPGCATGEEAYSLAILFREYMIEKQQDHKVLIYATDIDGDSIAMARPGKYPPNIAMDITAERLQKFFIREDRDYRVKKEIRDMVVFAVQNVIKDPPFTKLDLISCRNLLIYLEVELQNQLVPLFHYALRPGGVLVLGPSESIGASHDSFSTIDRKWRIFRTKNRIPANGHFLMNMPLASDLFVARGRTGDGASASLPDLSSRMILKSFGPPSVVTDEGGVLLYVHGETGNFLQPSPGRASLNVVDMARPGLDMELRAAIQNATVNKTAVNTRALKVIADGGTRTVDLVINPFTEVEGGRTLLLISFLERSGLADAKADIAKRGRGANAKRAEELERELSAAKENLQSIVEQMQGSHEELKSTNEELQSTNEELQSTNEELETSKEELQSVNEELISVNSELQAKNLNLLLTQSDLKNLLDNTNIGAIFLDENLIIRRFTRDAFRIFRLVATDVGRSLGDIKSRVEGEDLMEDVRSVMEYLVPRERTIRNSADEWFLARVLPYRTVENSVIGIVLTFIDITELKKIDSTLRKTEARFDQMTEQSGTVIWEADADGLFTYVSSVSDIVWGYRPEELVGKLHFYDLVVEAERETIKSRVFEIAKHGERFVGMEHAVRTRDGRILWNSTSGIPLLNRDGTLRGYQGSDTDITARKRAEQALVVSSTKYGVLFQSILTGITISDSQGKIVESNPEAERLLGLSQEEQARRNIAGEEWDLIRSDGTPMPPEEFASVRALKEQRAISNVEMGIVKGEDVVWINVNAVPMPLEGYGVAITYADVTERKQAEEALQESETRFRTMFQESPFGIALIDSQSGRIYEVNKRFAEIAGRSQDELQTIDWMSITHPDDVQRDQEQMARMNAGKIPGFQMQKRYLRPDGSIVWVKMTIAPLKELKVPYPRHLCMIEDIGKGKQKKG